LSKFIVFNRNSNLREFSIFETSDELLLYIDGGNTKFPGDQQGYYRILFKLDSHQKAFHKRYRVLYGLGKNF